MSVEPLKARVVVVGAGPAGGACAAMLALLGIDPVVLVDRATFPRPKPCAGGLGPGAGAALASLGIWDKVKAEANLITGLRGVTPSGRRFETSGRASALVLPRERFDAMLAFHARDLGVRFVMGERVTSVMWDGGTPAGVVTSKGRTIEAVWTVIASGGRSKLAPAANGRGGTRLLRSAIARYESFEVDAHFVEVYFDRAISPMYGWVFPEGPSTANVGLCYDWDRFPGRPPKDVFYGFADRYLGDRLRKARRVGPLAGAPICTGFAPEGIARPGLLVAGEAGWLVNPVTGEGIPQALTSGILAAEAIADHLKGRRGAVESAARYERRVKLSVCPGLLIGEVFRAIGPGILELAPTLQSLMHT
jgi:geranylgeranyl reductase family protein